MTDGEKARLRLEIAHVLFIDIVGYSRLSIDEQSAAIEQMNSIVQRAETYRRAEAERRLVKIPTGDGMALVFFDSPEAPVECALEISRMLTNLAVRMGIHSGPVSAVVDVNGRANVAGEGINMAQRVMDCGDAGHILLSKRVADDLAQFKHWRPHLHELGECQVKHEKRISLVNLFTSEVGNSDRPAKLDCAPSATTTSEGTTERAATPRWWWLVAAALLVVGIAATVLFSRVRGGKTVNSPPARVPEKSIAVLPFENLSDEKQNAYFADGVQDEILTDLAKVADLKVISRTSVMPYRSGVARNLREIGKQLGVAHLLEGSVQRSNNRIRVNAQLIDARTDAHLWAQTYDRDLADVFAIQSEVAKAIADQLQAKILPAEKDTIEKQPTKDIAAYDFYVRATEAIDSSLNSDTPKQDTLQAIDFLRQAIARDQKFLRAYCKLAQAHDQLYLLGSDHTTERLALAERAVNDALRLQPDASEAHLALARHLYSKLDYEGARQEIEIARRTLPNESQIFELSGYIDRRQGRWPESTRNLERALELDPNNVVLLAQIAESYTSLREYGSAASALDRILALNPKDLDNLLARAQLEIRWKADPKPLHQLIESLLREKPQTSGRFAGDRLFLAMAERDAEGGRKALADFGQNTYGPDAILQPVPYAEGIFARLRGDSTAAKASFTKARAFQEKIVEAQPDYGPALCVLGQIDAALGRKEDAIREGRRAAELMPPSQDSINGAHIAVRLASIYAWVGQKDLAVEQLARAVQLPSGTHYGILRLFPEWDPLRGDPRFEKIVQSLAPKESVSTAK
jgi:serine/threonine-protein kinase